MAKKKSNTADRVNKRIRERDKVTMGKIVDLADDVAKCAFKGNDICLAIPQRTRSNTIWNRKRGILQMGEAKAQRELFNLNQAKQFMQTCLHGNSIKELIGAEKTLSLRGMFYKGLHTIAGTKSEKTFAAQDESDAILEDVEVEMGSLREDLHV
jgi:DNA topoisomerase-6 subunit A